MFIQADACVSRWWSTSAAMNIEGQNLIGAPRGRKRGFLAALAITAMTALFPAGAPALTADGCVMTSVANVTFCSIAGVFVGFKVSYGATAPVLICNPLVAYTKTATPTMSIPTGTVTFSLCIINNSSTTSAFNMVVSDKLPDNMSYVQPSYGIWGGTATMTNAAVMAGPWSLGEPPDGQANPMYLRWTVEMIPPGPGRSACVDFAARVL